MQRARVHGSKSGRDRTIQGIHGKHEAIRPAFLNDTVRADDVGAGFNQILFDDRDGKA